MKLVLVIGGFYLLSSIGIKKQQDKSIYYCDSEYATKYHFSENCKGLEKCTHKIVKTDIETVKKLKLTVCLIEK